MTRQTFWIELGVFLLLSFALSWIMWWPGSPVAAGIDPTLGGLLPAAVIILTRGGLGYQALVSQAKPVHGAGKTE